MLSLKCQNKVNASFIIEMRFGGCSSGYFREKKSSASYDTSCKRVDHLLKCIFTFENPSLMHIRPDPLTSLELPNIRKL